MVPPPPNPPKAKANGEDIRPLLRGDTLGHTTHSLSQYKTSVSRLRTIDCGGTSDRQQVPARRWHAPVCGRWH
eukprot:8269881-Pyramimonas_sp.AAC.1